MAGRYLLFHDEQQRLGLNVVDNYQAGEIRSIQYCHKTIVAQWLDGLQYCRPVAGHLRVRYPRPKCFWPVDVLELDEILMRNID